MVSEDMKTPDEGKWMLVLSTPWALLTLAGFFILGSPGPSAPEDHPIGILNGCLVFLLSNILISAGRSHRAVGISAMTQAGALHSWYSTLVAVCAGALEEASIRKQWWFGYAPFKDESAVDEGLELDGLTSVEDEEVSYPPAPPPARRPTNPHVRNGTP